MKNYFPYIVAGLTFIACTILYACKEPDKPTYYLDQEFKDYTLFRTGSKWIYREESSGAIDTASLVFDTVYIGRSNHSAYDFERYFEHVRTSYYNKTLVIIGEVNPPQRENTSYSVFQSMFFMTEHVHTFISRKPVGTSLPMYENIHITYVDSLATFNIENKVYKEIKLFSNNARPYDKTLPIKIYYAKNIGIIRKELHNGEVWNLVEYQVKQ